MVKRKLSASAGTMQFLPRFLSMSDSRSQPVSQSQSLSPFLSRLKSRVQNLFLFLLLPAFLPGELSAQSAHRLIDHFTELQSSVEGDTQDLFSVVINSRIYYSGDFQADREGIFTHEGVHVQAAISETSSNLRYRTRIIRFRNLSGDTLEIENLVPLGVSASRPYITGHGPPGLARATLFRPGKGPVGLIVPDNAWEMGWSTLDIPPDSGISVLVRREAWEGAQRRRYSTLIYPGGEVSYRIYTEKYRGDWKSGLVHLFRDRWLYDMQEFDNRLYERPDLRWIAEDYLAALQFAWDQDFYSAENRSYAPFREFFHRFDHLHGGYDIYGLWQGWPRLGLDSRNQWDLFRDLPGGMDSLRAVARYCRDQGSAFFISYNPWDESTRQFDHLEAMTEIIRDSRADGVVLDTRGSSSTELQEAADNAREGVVMYSEGMAVPADMPGIISGRVHNAIRMSPPLNLNRLIKPEFQVFRVLDLRDGRLHREMAICLFNGYGAELNLFSPAHPWWIEEEYGFMGRCLMILRQNKEAFHDPDWVPLAASPDSIWINRWRSGEKTLYTILSLTPEGHSGSLFPVETNGQHWVSLWDHEEILPRNTPEGPLLDGRIDPFSPAYTGTRREGSVQVIAGFPELISWEVTGKSLIMRASRGDRIVLWKGDPSYSNHNKSGFSLDPAGEIIVPLSEWMHLPEGKIVIQLFQGKEILDERIIMPTLATPVRINETLSTEPYSRVPEGMVEVRGAPFQYYRGNDADFIPYPFNFDTIPVEVQDFYMDRYPVTNRQFEVFLRATGYHPADTANFLRHWISGTCPDSLADHPVVWVSLGDAREYARWTGKRLPSEVEWQYAAQGTDGRAWPWGEGFDSTRCNTASGHTTPVSAFPAGRSPFGVEDMAGNIWQLCDDEYSNGSFTFSMIRGGSFYKPTSSWWYVQGGPRSNHRTQMLLKTAPGFDRSETVGFRCVCDRKN